MRFLFLLISISLLCLTFLMSADSTTTGFKLTGPLTVADYWAQHNQQTFLIGYQFGIVATDPTLNKHLQQLAGKTVTVTIEVKR